MAKPKVVLLIFVSGKIVLTGAKVSASLPSSSRCQRTDICSFVLQFREEIYQAFAQIYPVLSDYRKN